MKRTLAHAAVPVFLFLCLVLGGSAQGIWRNLTLQLIGLSILAWPLFSKRNDELSPASRRLGWLLGTAFVLMLLQLVPLPPGLWTMLPGRGPIAEAYLMRGERLPWLPWSLAPYATMAALPLLTVPAAILAGVLLLGAYRSAWCVAAVAVGTAVSIALGAAQVSGGGPYLYPIFNPGTASGLFANPNHFGTLLLATIPFAAATIGRSNPGKKPERRSRNAGIVAIAAGGLVLVLLGIVLNGSLAALLLTVPVAAASLPLAVTVPTRLRGVLAGAAGIAAVAAVTGIASSGGLAAGQSTSVSSRAEIFAKTGQAIRDTFPVGTGIGSFERVYPSYEDPANVDYVFVNHAHNDPLEWILETGLPGLLLLVLFLVWWSRQAVSIWRSGRGQRIAKAATIASAAIMMHSLVDFPLRTAAIHAVFALCLAFMAEPRRRRREEERQPLRETRHLGIGDADQRVRMAPSWRTASPTAKRDPGISRN